MRLTAGNKVVYPSQGPCLIGPIVNRMIDERSLMFYQLIVLNGGCNLFVPVDKVQSIGIRLLLEKSEIPKLLDHLKGPSVTADTWKERACNNRKLLATGSAFDLAEIIVSLTELGATKALSFGEHKTLDRAKELLVCEICEVMGETKLGAEQLVESALKAQKDN